MATVVDYSAGVPGAAAIKAAGHIGAVRYISPPRPGAAWMKGKPMWRPELDDFDAHGLKAAMVWQFGKEADADVKRGFAGGVEDAHSAQAHLNSIKAAGHPVYFAVDFDIERSQWESYGRDYFKGAASVLGKQRVGIYGHEEVCRWAGPDENLVAEVEPGRHLCWVTKAWSGGKTGRDFAVLYQRVVDTKANPGPVVGGVVVDVNDVYHNDWGWRALNDHTTPAPGKKGENMATITPQHGRQGDPIWLPDVMKMFGVKVEYLNGWDNWGTGDFTNIEYVIVHHTAGANTSAAYIARNPGISNALSSQVHLARSGVATMCGVGIAYHAGEDNTGRYMPGYVTRPSASGPKSFTHANATSIGIEAVNRGDGTQIWPQVQMEAYYRICAAICWYLGLPVSRVLGHKEIAPGRKIDPNFNMNQFRNKVQEVLDNPPFITSKNKEIDPEMNAKIQRIWHELTHRFQSRYKDPSGKISSYRDSLVGFVLELDRKQEDIHANMLPAIYTELNKINKELAALSEKKEEVKNGE